MPPSRSARQNLFDSVYPTLCVNIRRRVPVTRIVGGLAAKGLTEQEAEDLYSEALEDVVRTQTRRGMRHAVWGGLVFFIGAGLTVVSLAARAGGGAVIWYGAIFFGVAEMAAGLTRRHAWVRIGRRARLTGARRRF